MKKQLRKGLSLFLAVMMLMSACHHHIISNSTFSWWGAWLNPRTDKVVLAPQQWDSSHMASEIVPPSWITINNLP